LRQVEVQPTVRLTRLLGDNISANPNIIDDTMMITAPDGTLNRYENNKPNKQEATPKAADSIYIVLKL